jgi:hypothetical protein
MRDCARLLFVGKRKTKKYLVKLQSEVAIEPYAWAFKHPGEALGGAGKQVAVTVEATSEEEAGELAKTSVEEDFPNTKGKLTVIGNPSVPTTSKKYV